MEEAYDIDISQIVKTNENYRKVIYTTKNMQLVVMNLKPGETIPEEVHPWTTQFFAIISGSGEAIVGGIYHLLTSDKVVIVPPGTRHYVANKSDSHLKLYTIYSPPEHPYDREDRRQVEYWLMRNLN